MQVDKAETSGSEIPAEGGVPPAEGTVPGSRTSDSFLKTFRLREGASPLERYSGVLLLGALILAFSIATSSFFTYQNFIGIADDQAVPAIISIGLLFPLASGVFDVSIAGVFSLSVVSVTGLFQATNGSMPVIPAVIIVLIGGCIAGLINALLIVRVRIDPFIATIGTSTVFEGLSQMIGNGSTIMFHIPQSFVSFGIAKFLGVPVDVLIVLGLALIAWYVLSQTPAGRMIYATGAARDASRLSGIRVNFVLTWSYVISAVLATAAGIIFAAQEGAGPPDTGGDFLLPAYATAFLGATIIKPGRFNVLGLLVAVMIIAVGINGLELVGLPFWIQDLFEGSALIGAVALTRLRSKAA